MRVVIIEDENLAAEDLIQTLKSVDPKIEILHHLKSVRESLEYFQENQQMDVIFSDIQLGDGLSFQIFKEIKPSSPIVFCTAYDDYLLDAFKTNGIDYLLKPISESAVEASLKKYHTLQQHLRKKTTLPESVLENLHQEMIQQMQPKIASIIVHQQDRIIPLPTHQIALCYIEFENVFIKTFDAKEYNVSRSLDDLEKILGTDFFRANRQHLVARNAVKHASYMLSRKLHLSLNMIHESKVFVSREKCSHFLRWLEGN